MIERHPHPAMSHLVGIGVSGALSALVALWGTFEWGAQAPIVNGEGFGALNLLIFPFLAFLAGILMASALFLPTLLACRAIQNRYCTPWFAIWPAGLLLIAALISTGLYFLSLRAPFVPRVVLVLAFITSLIEFSAYKWLLSGSLTGSPRRRAPEAA